MVQYMQLDNAKAAIIDIGKRMYGRGYVAANDGNISIRIGEASVLSTPTGVSKGFMEEDMLVITDLDGNMISGGGRPSGSGAKGGGSCENHQRRHARKKITRQ